MTQLWQSGLQAAKQIEETRRALTARLAGNPNTAEVSSADRDYVPYRTAADLAASANPQGLIEIVCAGKPALFDAATRTVMFKPKSA